MISPFVAPGNIPYEDDEEPTSRDSASSTLLDHGVQFKDVDYAKPPFWRRVVSYIQLPQSNPAPGRRRRQQSQSEACAHCEISTMSPRTASRRCVKLGIGFLLLLGIFQLFALVVRLPLAILPDRIHYILKNWGKPGQIGEGAAHYPTDFSRDILPIPCHSHNDYWRRVPLYSAIEAGCISVEADVWSFDNELYVGHDLPSLTINRTLHSLYIDPLVSILKGQNPITRFFNGSESRNGVFDTDPEQSLTLLIDFKTPGAATFPHVVSALAPLRERNYLTRRNGSSIVRGPITVVGTGNTPFELITSETANPAADIFFDAPLGSMYEKEEEETPPTSSPTPSTETPPLPYTPHNSYYASAPFSKTIGYLPTGQFSPHQLTLLRGQIRGAHRLGLKVRYWDLPFWPIGLRNHVWTVLVREGVDILNVDDLRGATAREWGGWRGWWGVGDGV